MDTNYTPSDWLAAGSDETEDHYPLFDSNLSTTAANTTLTYFGTAMTAATEKERNNEFSGSLPQSQRFLLQNIKVLYNDLVTSDDENSIAEGGYVKVTIQDRKRLHLPLHMIGAGGSVVPAGVTQDEDHIFMPPFDLKKNIVIPGGVPFKVEVVTGDTAPTTSTRVTVVLDGVLVRKKSA